MKGDRCVRRRKRCDDKTIYNKGLPRTITTTTTQKDNHHYRPQSEYDSITVILISMHTHQLVAFRIVLRIYLLRMTSYFKQILAHTHTQTDNSMLDIACSSEYQMSFCIHCIYYTVARLFSFFNTNTISFHTKYNK